MSTELLCDQPTYPADYVTHLRLLHGVWVTPSTAMAELMECHQAYTEQPGHAHIPHTHSDAPAAAEDAHGFW